MYIANKIFEDQNVKKWAKLEWRSINYVTLFQREGILARNRRSETIKKKASAYQSNSI